MQNKPEQSFTPPYPKPHNSKISLLSRYFKGRTSWIHVLFEKSYSMKMGQVFLPRAKVFVVNEKSLVKNILAKAEAYPKHKALGRALKALLGESIFTTNHKQWKRQRSMMDGAFAHTRLQKVFPLMNGAVEALLARLEKYGSAEINVDAEMTFVTADIIFRTILSYPLSEAEAWEVHDAFNIYQEAAQKAMVLTGYYIPDYFPRKRSEQAAQRIRNILAPIIKRRHEAYLRGEETENNDILAALMQARDPETGEAFGYAELVDHVSMLFLAGHETSASALTWSFYLIAECSHIQQGMLKELNEVFGGGEIGFEDIRKLEFTRDVFREALRLYPPVGFFVRETTQKEEMRGKKICPNDMIMISPWLIHRHKDQWEKPHEFCPHRFGTESGKASLKDSYLPFGGGPRICIGQGFAMQEAVLVLASVVQRFAIRNKQGHVPEPVSRVTIRPKNGVRINIEKRA